MATKADVMTTLCSAFGVFTAFGAAILAFFTSGTGLGRLRKWIVGSREEALVGGCARLAGSRRGRTSGDHQWSRPAY